MCYFVQSDVSKPKQRFDLIDYMFADVHYQENFLHTISWIYTFLHCFSFFPLI